MTTQSLITRQELKEVFAELEIIQAVSRTLIKHLQERLEKWFPNQKIGDVFGHLVDTLSNVLLKFLKCLFVLC
jgi:hypothetical protein